MGTEYVAVAFTILFTIATSGLARALHDEGVHREADLPRSLFVPIERLVLRVTASIRASSRTGSTTRSRS